MKQLHVFVLYLLIGGLVITPGCSFSPSTNALRLPTAETTPGAKLNPPRVATTPVQPTATTYRIPMTIPSAQPGVRDDSIHPAYFAGSLYPAEPEALSAMTVKYLSAAVLLDGAPEVLIVPHGNYQDTGQSLAAAFKQMGNASYDTAVLIGVDQRPPALASLAIWEKGGFRTPLGDVPIDEEFTRALLAADPAFQAAKDVFAEEDTLELPLPFLQQVCPTCKIVPILVTDENPDLAQNLTNALLQTIQTGHKKTIIIAVSNLSTNLKEEDALVVDNAILSAIESRDPQELEEAIEKPRPKNDAGIKQALSGKTPIMTGLQIGNTLGVDQALVLHYVNTASTPDGNPQHVNGYASMMFWHYEPPQFDENQRRELLGLARKAIRTYLETGEALAEIPADVAFQRKAGVFITLMMNEDLRGCIGHIEADQSIAEAVKDNAVAAAVSDPRFLRMTSDELDQVEIEISILSPLQRVKAVEDVEIGKHGLYMKYRGRQGILLPQMAVQQEWNRPKFLDYLCTKSGLAATCWQDNPTLYVFSALVFADK